MRQEMTKQLKSMDRLAYEQFSYQIHSQLVQTEQWKKSYTIGMTVSRFPELDTWQLIREGWEQGKRIVVPKCDSSTKTMSFFHITEFTQLESSYFNLFEPIECKTSKVLPSDIDLLIVPGLIYSTKGYRIGFGGGYYDRFLQDFTKPTISLAFSQQVVPEIPIESHDIPVQHILTEKGMIDCKMNKPF